MPIGQGKRTLISIGIFVILCFVGGGIMMAAEGKFGKSNWKSYQRWRYFIAITISTIGYGDVLPYTHLGKFFAMFFAFVGIPVYVYMVLTSGALLSKIIVKIKQSCHGGTIFNILSILSCAFVCIVYVVVLGVSVAAREKWHAFHGIYWAFVSISSIGYGDRLPNTLIEPCAELIVWFFTFCQILIVMTCHVVYNTLPSNKLTHTRVHDQHEMLTAPIINESAGNTPRQDEITTHTESLHPKQVAV